MKTPLAAIGALVRAGATARAWALFTADGHAARAGDPAVEALRGRLLKASARQASAADRPALYAWAAAAYARANALAPASYHAINAATLWLLAGDRAAAASGARAALALIDAPGPPADTPYYLAATRAEALLLLGDVEAAEAAFAKAAALAPDEWTDRAVTLAQLAEIATALGVDQGWLDRFAPPASLHFAGHMGLDASGHSAAQLADAVDRLIQDEAIGFGWGALAAGADLVIAERLLAAGASVNAVLPCPADRFARQSVAPAGPEWQRRFDAVVERLASLRIAAADPHSSHDPLATAYAGDLAIGGALLNARALGGRAVQLVVTDEAGGGANTAAQRARWPAASGRQHSLTIARDRTVTALFAPDQPDPARRLVVHIAIRSDDLIRGEALSARQIEAITRPVAAALDALPASAVRASPGGWDVVTEALDTAAAAMLAVHDNCRAAGIVPPSIGAHRAVSLVLADPASGALVPYGPAPDLARRLQAMAPPGLALISDALAVSIASRGEAAAIRSELYHPGEGDSDGPVHVLLPAGQ